MKSTLDIRPVSHWTPKRIEGHIMLCFLSFYMLKRMDMMLKNKDIGISIKMALEIISDIRAIEIKHDGRICIARTQTAGDKFKILQALSCRIPKAIIHDKVVAQVKPCTCIYLFYMYIYFSTVKVGKRFS